LSKVNEKKVEKCFMGEVLELGKSGKNAGESKADLRMLI